MNAFTEEYFKTQNYTNYLERGIRYKKMAQELAEYLWEYQGIPQPDVKFLDFGCAVGFLVKGFREEGYKCEGYDISDWAKSQAAKEGIYFVSFIPDTYDVMFALDVFEHMTDEQIAEALKTFDAKKLVTRIPCSTDGGKTYHLEISKKDPTHINCKTKPQWTEFFFKQGYLTAQKIDLYTIYDTEGVMCYLYSK